MERDVRRRIDGEAHIQRRGLAACVLLLICCLSLSGFGCRRANKQSDGQDLSGHAITLKAVRVAEPPSLDGIADPVWSDIPETAIPLTGHKAAEPRGLKLKAAFTDDNVYFLITYAESTPLRVSYPWVYQGDSRWTREPHGDAVHFIWNINDSIRGFNEQGADIVDVKPEPLDDAFAYLSDTFKMIESKKNSSYFASQKADIWSWCKTPELYDKKADDMVFAVMPSQTGRPREIKVQHDAHDFDIPWQKNRVTISGQERPKYKYKEGLNIDNAPWAYFDQMVEIADWSAFQPGDKLPDVICERGAVAGGSRDDIDAMSNLNNGVRTVEFGRKLNTGHDDDIRFNKKGLGRYTFVIAVYDGGLGIVYSQPIVLEITR